MFMRALLLNLFALLLMPHAVAAQKTVKVPVPAGDHNAEVKALEGNTYKLTDLQKARLDAARQEVFRWEDRMNVALAKFSELCTEAQSENHWPDVQCDLNTLNVALRPPRGSGVGEPAVPEETKKP